MDELSASPALRPGSVRVKKTAGVAGGGAADETSGSEEKVMESSSAVEDNKENIPNTTGSKAVRDSNISFFSIWLNMGIQVLYTSESNLCYVVMGL